MSINYINKITNQNNVTKSIQYIEWNEIKTKHIDKSTRETEETEDEVNKWSNKKRNK